MDDIVDITITAADADWLAAFVRGLVADRLVACGNIVPGVRSVYRWHDRIHDDPEALAVLHTRRSLVERVMARTEQEHPYDTPQLIVLPVLSANAGYHKWVLAQTSEAAGR